MSFDNELARFMDALGKVESSNNYQAIGADMGSKYGVARGRWQIMSEIWPGWAREAGIPGADWRDPAAQDAVVKHKMTKYYNKYGDWRLVAAAWFGGEGAANKMAKGGDLSGTNDGFINVPTYVQRVISNFGGDIAQGEAQSGFDNVATPQQSNVEVGDPLVDGMPKTERDELRKTYEQVLTTMSQVIAGNPGKYAGIYSEVGPDPELAMGTVPQEAE